MPSDAQIVTNRFGGTASAASARLPHIASRNGSASETPEERRKVRRERVEFMMWERTLRIENCEVETEN
jgi:hypothetical protein